MGVVDESTDASMQSVRRICETVAPAGGGLTNERGVLSAEAILFDLDGVLVDSQGCIDVVWELWAREHRLDPRAVLRVAHGRRTSETIRHVAPHLDVAAEVARLERMESEETRGLQAVPGASAMLHALSTDQWAIVTSGTERVARTRMRLCGVPEPAVFVTANDVHEGKPSPEGYLCAARQLGKRTSQCLVIEDTPPGVASGKAAGMVVIAVASTHELDALRQADFVVPRLEDIGIANDPFANLTIITRSAL